jgi:hypothetical protein
MTDGATWRHGPCCLSYVIPIASSHNTAAPVGCCRVNEWNDNTREHTHTHTARRLCGDISSLSFSYMRRRARAGNRSGCFRFVDYLCRQWDRPRVITSYRLRRVPQDGATDLRAPRSRLMCYSSVLALAQHVLRDVCVQSHEFRLQKTTELSKHSV